MFTALASSQQLRLSSITNTQGTPTIGSLYWLRRAQAAGLVGCLIRC